MHGFLHNNLFADFPTDFLESVVNIMQGRINFELEQVTLGGIKAHVPEIKRCRRLLINTLLLFM